jgi:hypothetical protein
VGKSRLSIEPVDLLSQIDDRGTVMNYSVKGDAFFPIMNVYMQMAKPVTTAYKQLALQKARSKMGSADLAMGENLGELRETLSMLRKPLGSLKKFLVDDKMRNLMLLKALASRDKRQVARLLGRTGLASSEAMTSTWLEIRYGLRPLMYLVQDVIEKVNTKAKGVWDPKKIRSARTKLHFTENFDKDENWYVPYSWNWYGHISVEDEIWVNASVQYRQSNEFSLLNQLGLTPRHLPEVAWELTRLSFVVDWIFSIGPWLGSLRIAPEIEVLGNTVGVKTVRTMVLDDIKYRTRAGSSLCEVEETARYTDSVYERTVNNELEFLPHFTWGRTLDVFKAIDAASLIWQFLPKGWKNPKFKKD